ncbi:MAG: hypothetical protein WDM79_14510 [Terricaulis sp.]
MQRAFTVLLMGFALAACGEAAPNEFPAQAQAEFHSQCPADNPVCTCTWDRITRAVTYEEYEAAMATFRAEGTMDTRITHASVKCREQHAG